MRKVLHVARREFLATAGTRAFIFGILVTPLVIGVLILLIPWMSRENPPAISGDVAVIDPTGRVAGGLAAYLEPARIEKRRQEAYQRIQDAMPPALRSATGMSGRGGAAGPDAASSILGKVPRLRVVPVEPGASVESEKAALTEASDAEATGSRLALVVVHADAVQKKPGTDRFGTYDLFVRSRLDDRVIEEIDDGVRDAIIGARVSQAGLDRAQVEDLTTVDKVS
jgi:ABC-type Na+ efflux pump permease subunit